jgi:hypothetical protein
MNDKYIDEAVRKYFADSKKGSKTFVSSILSSREFMRMKMDPSYPINEFTDRIEEIEKKYSNKKMD